MPYDLGLECELFNTFFLANAQQISLTSLMAFIRKVNLETIVACCTNVLTVIHCYFPKNTIWQNIIQKCLKGYENLKCNKTKKNHQCPVSQGILFNKSTAGRYRR